MSDKAEDEPTIATDLVVTKYKVVAEIVNQALKSVVERCVDGATILELCELGDKIMLDETGKVFKKEKDMRRGIAFPTCVSVNNCICHNSPLKSDTPAATIHDGDLVKIDLGAHIDGFIAVCAHSLVVGATPENPVTGPKADVMNAAHYAASLALRLVVPGGENDAVTDAIQKVSESYGCKPISGMLSHQLKQFRIDGEKSIIQNPTEAQRKGHEKCEFQVHEVYAIDVLISTGEGKGRELDTTTTIYKKTEELYQLKMKASRAVYSDVDKKFGLMPFNLRYFDDENKAKLGLKECVNHKLIEPFQVLHEKEGEYVAQFKFTVLLLPSRSHKITGLSFDTNIYKSDKKIKDPAIVKLLNASNPSSSSSASKKKKKNNKLKKAAAAAVEAVTAPAGEAVTAPAGDSKPDADEPGK